MAGDSIHSLADALVRRKKTVTGGQAAIEGLLIASATGFLAVLVDHFLGPAVVGIPIVAIGLGAGATLGYVWGAGRPTSRYHALLDADRVYRSHEQLATAFELWERNESHPFARAILDRVVAVIGVVEPARLYRLQVHRRYLLLPALLLATAVVAGLEPTSGVSNFLQLGGEQPSSDAKPSTTQTTERKAEGLDLASELEEMGLRPTDAQATPGKDEPAPQELPSVEDQVRRLEREHLQDDGIGLGENAEETLRRALRRGMSESEILDLVTRMKNEGETTPEILEQLDENASEMPPNATLDREPSDDAADTLKRQLMPVPPSEDTATDSDPNGRIDPGDPTEGGQAELAEGVDYATGEGESRETSQEPGNPPETEGEEQAQGESPSDRGGKTPAKDGEDDDFAPVNESRVAQELTGKVIEETFLNLVIRDLPEEARAELEQAAPEVRYERAIERAIENEQVSPEMEPIVRSYFLRIARRTNETGEERDQGGEE